VWGRWLPSKRTKNSRANSWKEPQYPDNSALSAG
jgi:hypothetical protein